MRGVCVDALNPRGAPTARQLRSLMPIDPCIRQVLFDESSVYDYLERMARADIGVAVVAAGESFRTDDYRAEMFDYAAMLKHVQPSIWLIGNEPNAPAGSASSWTLTPDAYVDFWNSAVAGVRAADPRAKCYIGGLLGPPGEWFDAVYPRLNPRPDGIDIHYPENENVLSRWATGYGLPLSVMEWCWAGRGVRESDVVSWQKTLCMYANDTAWFSYHDIGGAESYMALVGPSGHKRKAWHHYHAAVS